ncbi:MotA/TolQ/ExbB proton channel family protein [Aporhodopirellula aestuarii]|uniref:MotA/TolQ/ExbB proton channel family protein n=1 Tax=Aporhodopirellula aestuarii TaxID=2950107 RepID=A0ABT0U566_9BACT|nr:MotA/TolQ/ExbB proton channel family protein [Aporhodopirellula aestuarii]MCM2372048.1 MotA/TolQ/ExbB proton channel family protein [Aporhodopirellula aestuarii]
MATFFKISCPGCGKALKVSDNLCGKSRACPYCRATVRIPDVPPAEPEGTPPEIKIDLRPPGERGGDDATASAPGTKPSQPPTKPAAVSSAVVSPSVSTTPTVAVEAPKRRKTVRRKRAEKSWFRSSSDSASSDVSLVLSGLIAAAVSAVWFAALYPFRESYLGALFWMRGPVPFPTTFLMFWAVAILVLKWIRLQEQRDAMLLDVLPTEVSREITIDSIDGFIEHINELPGASSDSFLINRVVRGIEHFRVRKSAAETVTMMESQSEIDANNVAGSYTVLKVFIWALPILGFIGTVMGVSSAVASLAGSLSSGGSMDAMKGALQEVFGGLGTAFDTTLLALIMSMLVKIPASALQKGEEDLITRVDEYCNENLLRRLNDGREGGAERGLAGGGGAADTKVFRDAVEQALGTQHAEMERWLSKLDAIGGRLTSQVSKGWDEVNARIEEQQQKHVEVLHQQQLDQQARLQAQLDQMANAADKIQTALTKLADQTESLQNKVNETYSQTGETLTQHLDGVQTGLSSLSSVLNKLGDQQVVVQQVAAAPEAKKGWFSRNSRSSRRGGKRS